MTAITALRGRLTTRRTTRAARRRLERELASFDTVAQRRELEAMLTRHSPEATREIRAILAAQDRSRAATATWISGGHLAA